MKRDAAPQCHAATSEGRPCSRSCLALARRHRHAVRKHALTIENENTSGRRQLVRRPVGTHCCLAGVWADSIYYIVYTRISSWAPSLMGPWASHRPSSPIGRACCSQLGRALRRGQLLLHLLLLRLGHARTFRRHLGRPEHHRVRAGHPEDAGRALLGPLRARRAGEAHHWAIAAVAAAGS